MMFDDDYYYPNNTYRSRFRSYSIRNAVIGSNRIGLDRIGRNNLLVYENNINDTPVAAVAATNNSHHDYNHNLWLLVVCECQTNFLALQLAWQAHKGTG